MNYVKEPIVSTVYYILQVKIITEKEQIIKETSISLCQYRDNSVRDSAEADMLRDRVTSLELEITKTKSTCVQLTNVCEQLRPALEPYKKRCEQLESDNRKHVDSVGRYQSKIKELESVGNEVENLRVRIAELEGDADQFRENEGKYKHMLSQMRAQVSKLTADVGGLKEEIKRKTAEMNSAGADLELNKDTIEKLNHEILEKGEFIVKLNLEMSDKDEFIVRLKRNLKAKDEGIEEMDKTCEEMKRQLDNANVLNQKLDSQLEQQRLTCGDYKRQVEKQNQLTRDLKERMERVREELTQSLHGR